MMTLICGHTRAGKTTFSEQFDNVIHFDDIHNYRKVIEMVKKSTCDVVVEGIYCTKQSREELCKAYWGKTKCILIETSDEIRAKRMGRKRIGWQPFDIPSYEEGWDEIIVLRGDDNEQRSSR